MCLKAFAASLGYFYRKCPKFGIQKVKMDLGFSKILKACKIWEFDNCNKDFAKIQFRLLDSDHINI